MLLKRGAEPNQVVHHGLALLILDVMDRCLELVAALLDAALGVIPTFFSPILKSETLVNGLQAQGNHPCGIGADNVNISSPITPTFVRFG